MKVCPPQKIKNNKTTYAHICQHPNGKTIDVCLHYSIPCACFYVCGCCSAGGRACMKWSATNMDEGRRQLNCFCDECWLRFPWTNNPRGVRGSLSFYCYFAFVLLCALHLFSCVCVCVRTLREGCRHDGPLSPHVHAVEPCVPLLFASPLPSACWCCGSSVCVCVLPWIGVCVVCGVRRTVHAWLLPSPHVVCPLCVSAAPLVSPVALHVPHCADQPHNTERPHSR
ncbi:hypothetical protein ECC02_010324 [Trypanosoma cruzi]|uniref:Mucin TcMUC n=1 Tax=Trypanosoma cruzi TaxID=5693 RepID=A0A7J6XQY2_TRYCR|nr:hypothetical protein ECC02_010324 [Trypanosoma cruzi]